MPKKIGKFVALDTQQVKGSAKKTIEFLKNKLPQTAARTHVVVFLGEEHNNTVDNEVTQSIMAAPPLVSPGKTRVIFERRLDNVYVPGVAFTDVRTERTDLTLNRVSRSKLIAEMIMDAFGNGNMDMVYVVCGSAHSTEIFDHLDRKYGTPFTFISKPSSTD